MPRLITLTEIANAVDGSVMGDGSYVVESIAPVDTAGARDISFLSSDKYASALGSCSAGCVLLSASNQEAFSGNKILVENPYLAYAKISALFNQRAKIKGVHPSAVVASSARIGVDVGIGANCVVGENVVIGDGTEISAGCVIGDSSSIGTNGLLHANVTIYAQVVIGNNVIIHSGTAVGSDGFGFAPYAEGWQKIHQLGSVVIGDDVEIGAGTAIDRGALENTVIGDGVIIDNQVHIAHNVRIGKNSAIAGCVGIAGSTDIGENCTVAGAVAINGHIKIADNSHYNGGTIVTKGNDTGGTFASGTPMMDVKKWRRTSVRYSQLDELASRIKDLEKKLDANS